ncbi:MAG TPA: alpha/beta hydrolase [Streptosporangiaceae bacterium]
MAYLERDGVRIHYDRSGSDNGRLPLLLTHGYGASAQMWGPNIVALAAAGPVITWDLRGHGSSDCPDDQAEYTQAASVADMAAVLDACDAPCAVVGGLSLGGYLSLAFWLAHPERVAALLLCDTGPGYRNDEARQRWNDRAIRTAQRLERDGLAALGPGPHTPDAANWSPRGLAMAARGILTQQDGSVIESLPSIDVPVLVLVGADDQPFLGAADYLSAKIPRARKVVIENAGHMCNIDKPDLFDRYVMEFLSQAG